MQYNWWWLFSYMILGETFVFHGNQSADNAGLGNEIDH